MAVIQRKFVVHNKKFHITTLLGNFIVYHGLWFYSMFCVICVEYYHLTSSRDISSIFDFISTNQQFKHNRARHLSLTVKCQEC